MKSKNKIKARKASSATRKKARACTAVKSEVPETIVIRQREVEHQFMAEHPEAFDPYVGEWVVVEGPKIVSHGMDATAVVNEARSAGIKVPYIVRVTPKRKPNEGYL
jgi:hypothetical protein